MHQDDDLRLMSNVMKIFRNSQFFFLFCCKSNCDFYFFEKYETLLKVKLQEADLTLVE